MDLDENTRKKEKFMTKAIADYEKAFQDHEEQKIKWAEEIRKTMETNKFKEGFHWKNGDNLHYLDYEVQRNKDVENEITSVKKEHQVRLNKMALKHRQELQEIKVIDMKFC